MWTFINFQIRNVSHSKILLFQILRMEPFFRVPFFPISFFRVPSKLPLLPSKTSLKFSKNRISYFPEERRLQELGSVPRPDQNSSSSTGNPNKSGSYHSKRRWRKPISCISVKRFSSCKTSWFITLLTVLRHAKYFADLDDRIFLFLFSHFFFFDRNFEKSCWIRGHQCGPERQHRAHWL